MTLSKTSFFILCNSSCVLQFDMECLRNSTFPRQDTTLPEHTWVICWAAECKQTFYSALPPSAPSPVSWLILQHTLEHSARKRISASTFTLAASLCPTCFELHRLFPSQMAILCRLCCFPYGLESCTDLHLPLKTTALHLRTFLLFALRKLHWRSLHINCSSWVVLGY